MGKAELVVAEVFLDQDLCTGCTDICAGIAPDVFQDDEGLAAVHIEGETTYLNSVGITGRLIIAKELGKVNEAAEECPGSIIDIIPVSKDLDTKLLS